MRVSDRPDPRWPGHFAVKFVAWLVSGYLMVFVFLLAATSGASIPFIRLPNWFPDAEILVPMLLAILSARFAGVKTWLQVAVAGLMAPIVHALMMMLLLVIFPPDATFSTRETLEGLAEIAVVYAFALTLGHLLYIFARSLRKGQP